MLFQGLCKLGTTGGGTVNDQTFVEGATLKLYKSVRRWVRDVIFWKNDHLLHIVGREDDVVIPLQHQRKIGRLSNKDGEGDDEHSTVICPR